MSRSSSAGPPRRPASAQQPVAPAHRPRAITAIVILLLIEALTLLAVAVWYVAGMLTSTGYAVGVAVFTLVLLLLMAGWLLAISYYLFRGYRWTRAAALVWQLFLIVLAFPLLNADLLLPALIMIVPAAVILILLFTRPVVAFMDRRAESSRAF